MRRPIHDRAHTHPPLQPSQAAAHQLLVLVTCHRMSPDAWPGDGLWYSKEIPEAQVMESWRRISAALCPHWNVFAAGAARFGTRVLVAACPPLPRHQLICCPPSRPPSDDADRRGHNQPQHIARPNHASCAARTQTSKTSLMPHRGGAIATPTGTVPPRCWATTLGNCVRAGSSSSKVPTHPICVPFAPSACCASACVCDPLLLARHAQAWAIRRARLSATPTAWASHSGGVAT